MAKIAVKNPIVEMDGDEMTRIIWQAIKERLILPWLDVELNLLRSLCPLARCVRGIASRWRRARRCASTGSGSSARPSPPTMPAWKSSGSKRCGVRPMGRSATCSTAPSSAKRILCKNVPRLVPGWTEPIIIARHAYADQYRATEMSIPGPGTLSLRFEPEGGGRGARRRGTALSCRRDRALYVQRG